LKHGVYTTPLRGWSKIYARRLKTKCHFALQPQSHRCAIALTPKALISQRNGTSGMYQFTPGARLLKRRHNGARWSSSLPEKVNFSAVVRRELPFFDQVDVLCVLRNSKQVILSLLFILFKAARHSLKIHTRVPPSLLFSPVSLHPAPSPPLPIPAPLLFIPARESGGAL